MQQPNYKEQLLKLAYAKMPYGKYEGRYLSDLPEYYVIWLKNNRLPNSTLGRQVLEVYELKVNGMEGILRDLRQRFPKP
ncbi:DUF3820 family protein [Flavobacterium sp. MAH-1]|uniref:DUF3820 family protein n=1 Tax=Flavobacterium agri TaxID=2743471 RepID=A0A7Y9C6T6_9FLAO|nr:DUF3820 family protein [Flavobacterium agri]NUY82426.1 DUF3820 family protein [Flavobacterium agri]NYA72450.1 DUF3820 family protein [Flavobacterium agri]